MLVISIKVLISLFITSFGQEIPSSFSKRGGIAFRTDDNQPISQYLEYGELFNRYNKKFCFAINLGRDFEMTSEYLSGLRQLQASGHEMLDHTPWHNTFWFKTILSTNVYVGHPGVERISGDNIDLKYAKVKLSDSKRNGYVEINHNIVSSSNGIFANFSKSDCYLYFPSIDKLVWIQEQNWIDNNSVRITDFWGKSIDLGIYQQIEYYNFDYNNVHLTSDALKALAEEFLRLANYYNLERPYSWIQPGGYFPHVYRGELKRSIGETLGYTSAGVFADPSLKVFNEYNPDNDKGFGMNFGDFQENTWTLEQCKSIIADRIAKHHVVFGESHFNWGGGLLGGWSGFLDRTEKLIQWSIANNIPIRTYSEWADVLYNQTPDPYENMFPPLNVDLDANNIPDGYDKNNQGILITNDGKPNATDYSYSIRNVGQICSITNLGGVEKGENNFEIWTKGAPGNFIEIIFKVGTQDLVYKFPAENNQWTKYTLAQSINGNKSLNIPNNISLINVNIKCSNFNSEEVRISGMKMNKLSSTVEYMSVSPSSQSVSSSSGTTNFDISSNINWNISSNASWLNTTPSSGNGNSTIIADFSSNTNSSERIGIITVTGGNLNETVSVVQQGFSPYLTVTPMDRSVTNFSGNTTFSIESNTSWSLSDDAQWLTISPVTGSGSTTITASFTENLNTTSRIGSILVSTGGINKSVTVSQSAAPTILEVLPTDLQVSSGPGTIEYTITSNTYWTVQDDADWLNIDPASGSNNGIINVNYTSNPTYEARTANLNLTGGGKTLNWQITQEASPYLNVLPEELVISYKEGSTIFTIQSNTNWIIEDSLEWLKITPLEGSNTSDIEVSFTTNTDSIDRIGQILIKADSIVKVVTIIQESFPFLIITPSELYTDFEEGTITFTIHSNRNWVIEKDSDWLTTSSVNGFGDAVIDVSYIVNPDSVDRVGQITVSADSIVSTLLITQKSSPVLNIIPSEQIVDYNEGIASFTIRSNREWSLEDDSEWLIVTPINGSGNGNIEVSYTENKDSVQRAGQITLTASGVLKKINILQESSPVLSITPGEKHLSYEAGTAYFAIRSNRDWIIEENLDWLDVTPTRGSQNGSFEMSYSSNNDSLERVGQLIVSADGVKSTITVKQESTPALNIIPAEQFVSDSSGTAVFYVTSNRNWTAIVNSDWIESIDVDSTLLSVNYLTNTDTLERTGQIQILAEGISQSAFVIQAARKYLAISQNYFKVGSDAGSVPLQIYSNVTWEIDESLAWLEINKRSSSNSDTVLIYFAPNVKALPREGKLILSCGNIIHEIVVWQEGAMIQFVVNPKRSKVSADSGKVSINIYTNTIWQIQNSHSWLSISPDSGEGNTQVVVSFEPNQDSLTREGSVYFLADSLLIKYVLEQHGLDVFQISALVDSIGSGVTVGSGRYISGSLVTLSAHPSEGWKFKFWEENKTNVSTDSIYTFNVINSRILIAKFENLLTSVTEQDLLVDKFDLFQNYPNPFNPSTRIKFSVPNAVEVKICLYNAFGEKIEDLFQRFVTPGFYEVTFNGTNLASGIYFYRMLAGDFILTRKMLLMK